MDNSVYENMLQILTKVLKYCNWFKNLIYLYLNKMSMGHIAHLRNSSNNTLAQSHNYTITLD